MLAWRRVRSFRSVSGPSAFTEHEKNSFDTLVGICNGTSLWQDGVNTYLDLLVLDLSQLTQFSSYSDTVVSWPISCLLRSNQSTNQAHKAKRKPDWFPYAARGQPRGFSGAFPSSCSQIRGPLAQGNEPLALGDGLLSVQDHGRISAQGSGPRFSPGHDCPSAQGDGVPSDQGYSRPCAAAVGLLLHKGMGGVCDMNSEPEQAISTISECSVDSETNLQSGQPNIVLNTILCFTATKKVIG